MKSSFLKSQQSRSPLEQTRVLSGGRSLAKPRAELAIALPLTSLIDAFSIIVIYLLIGTQSGGLETKVPDKMQLPIAVAGQSIEKTTSTIRIENNQYFINDEQTPIKILGAKLFSLKKSLAESGEMEVMVQADRQLEYQELSPILKATAEAGIQKIKFAVTTQK